MRAEIGLGTRDEERPREVQRMGSLRIHIASIHNVNRACLRNQEVERIHVVQLAVGHMDDA